MAHNITVRRELSLPRVDRSYNRKIDRRQHFPVKIFAGRRQQSLASAVVVEIRR
jgi:hypothetical protein